MRIAVVTTEGVSCRGTASLWGDMFAFSTRSIGVLALSLLHDPAILGACPSPLLAEEVPPSRLDGELDQWELLLVPHPGIPLPGGVVAAIDRGLPVMLAAPEPEELTRLKSASGLVNLGPLLSMDEEWGLGGRAFDYPQSLCFERWQAPPKSAVLSTIGEWPDAVVLGNLAITATDSFHAADLFRPIPAQHRPGGFQDLFPRHLAALLGAVLGLPPEAPRRGEAMEEYDLRRDFHAFGFARLMVRELLERLGRPTGMADADATVWRAARSWRAGTAIPAVQDMLKGAFVCLNGLVEDAAPPPRFLLDSLHGGVLIGDHGFAEYDSPRYVRDWFDLYAHWIEARGYRFSVEIGAGSLAKMAGRYPDHLAKMGDYIREGTVEAVNGTLAQPYPYLLTLSSNARQFAAGREALRRVSGQAASTYVSQEFGLTDQHPGLLRQFGYDLACHRAQNWGDTPVGEAPAFLWQGANGDRLLALAANNDRSERRIGTIYLDWPVIVADAVKAGIPLLALTNLLDFFWMPAFREEIIRANHYAPIFGRFVTFRELRPMLAALDPAPRSYAMDDYTIDGFSRYPWAGGISGTLRRALEAENRLFAVDLLRGLAHLLGLAAEIDTKPAWEALLDLENHDCFCVPHAEAGGHTSHYTSIVGPRRSVTVLEAAGGELSRALIRLKPARAALLDALAPLAPGDGPYLALNLCALPCRTHLPLPNGTTLALDLPPLGLARAAAFPAAVATDTEPYLANEFLRVLIDTTSGAIALYHAEGGDAILPSGQELCWDEPGRSATRLETWEIARTPHWQRASMHGRIEVDGRPRALFAADILLAAGSRRVEIRTEIFPVRRIMARIAKEGEPPDDQWVHSLKVAFGGRWSKRERISQNVLEETAGHRPLSPAGLCLTGDTGRVMLHTRALPHFMVEPGLVRLVLWHEREERTVFEYAVEMLEEGMIPLARSLVYQHPPLIHQLPPPHPPGCHTEPLALLDLRGDEGLDVFGIFPVPDGLDLWCAEIAGMPRTLRLRTPRGCRRAFLALLGGGEERPLRVEDGWIEITTRAWDLFRLELRGLGKK